MGQLQFSSTEWDNFKLHPGMWRFAGRHFGGYMYDGGMQELMSYIVPYEQPEHPQLH